MAAAVGARLPANGNSEPQESQLQNFTDAKDDGGVSDIYAPGNSGMVMYNMFYTISRLNIRLHEGLPSTPAVYYAQSESFTMKPSFFLRKGDSKSSPVVSYVQFSLSSRHMVVGKGDYRRDSENVVGWSALEREKSLLGRSDYHFSTSEGSDDVQKEYIWRKDKNKWAATVYDCVDPDGRVVARLLSGGMLNWKKAGEMGVLGSLDDGLREMLLACAIGIWTMESMDFQSTFQGFKNEQT